MRVAFYAPMKPPDHAVPSGDRQMARLLMEALGRAGHQAELASRLRSRDGNGEPSRQARLQVLGQRLAERLIRRYAARPATERPRAWLTYHLYYKAPDWIGPTVSESLGIPYLAAEASVANKRAGGPWDMGHQATLAALSQAAAVIAINPVDAECLPDPRRVRKLSPFLDRRPYAGSAEVRTRHRAALAARCGLDDARCWLTAVAMMRPGDKLDSYRLLAQALQSVPQDSWHLLVAGDGPARVEVEAAFAWAAPDQVRFLGELDSSDLPAHYAACDLLAWPAVNEAYGMALLEAQASGLPVVAGVSGGVPEVVQHGETGLLTPPGDIPGFAAALWGLIEDGPARHRMAVAARAKVEAAHGIGAAARRLDEILREAVGES